MRRILSAAVTLGALVAAAAPDGRAAPAAAEPCVAPAAWVLPEPDRPRVVSAAEVLRRISQRDVVLLGENHDDDDHHRWQLQVLAALHAQSPDLVIGFEMFPRRVQGALDRWVAGELTVRQFLEQSEWSEVWKLPAELYLPLFQFARINRIPMVALNVDPSLTRAIAERGWDAIPEAERAGIGRPAAPVDAYTDFLFEIYRQHQVPGGKDAAKPQRGDVAFARFVESQTTWDRAMAEALARHVNPPPETPRKRAVGIMGGGHVRYGHGVAHQLRALGIASVATLLPIPAAAACKDIRPGFADAVFAMPRRAIGPAEPPRLGVQLEQKEGVVSVSGVSAGSLAEKTGLRVGDTVLEIAGVPVKSSVAVAASVRLQPDGTWLPMRVKRSGDVVELVVKFPPKEPTGRAR